MARTWAFTVWVLVFVVAAAVVAGIVRSEAASAPSDELRLNEILAGPTRDWDGDGAFVARQDEWLEVANAGIAPLDLGSYRLTDADSTIRYAFFGSLAPGAVLLVTGRTAEDWQRSAGRTVTGLSLNNAGDIVRLFRIDSADTVEVDTKAYGSIEGASDRSTGRFGAGGAVWALFDALNPYTGPSQPQGTGCAPTPKFENGCPTPVERTTWGKIKLRYR